MSRALAGCEDSRVEVGERLDCVVCYLEAMNFRRGRPLGPDQMRDLAQDVRLNVWRRLEGFLGHAALESWVYRFCHTGLIQSLSRGRSRELRRKDAQFHYAESRRDELVQNGPGAGTSSDLGELLRHLSPQEAAVTHRRHVEQLEFQEIATELGISTSSAKTHYYRAVEKLRTVLEGRESNHG